MYLWNVLKYTIYKILLQQSAPWYEVHKFPFLQIVLFSTQTTKIYYRKIFDFIWFVKGILLFFPNHKAFIPQKKLLSKFLLFSCSAVLCLTSRIIKLEKKKNGKNDIHCLISYILTKFFLINNVHFSSFYSTFQ